MDFRVREPTETVLKKAESYFARRWPHGGAYNRVGATSVVLTVTEMPPAGKWFTDLIKVVVLSLLTLGLYFVYWIFSPFDNGLRIHKATVLATEEGEGSLVTLTSSRPDYQETLESWAREEFGSPDLAG